VGPARLQLQWTGKFTPVPVHHLVLEVFVGPRPEGTVACHNNGDGYDNRVRNLRWDTRKANAAGTRFAMGCTAITSQSCPMRRCSNFFSKPTRRVR